MCRFALVALVVAACGGDEGTEIGGDIVLTVGTDTITPTAGAVIRDRDPAKAMIVIGTRDISCSTNLQSPLRKGTYVTMVIDPVAGVQTEAQVTVVRVDSSGTLFNGGTSEVTIDAIDSTVTGSLSFATIDDTEDGPVDLGASGTFEVANCFL